MKNRFAGVAGHVNSITYRYDANDLTGSHAPVCNRLREIIRDLGPNR